MKKEGIIMIENNNYKYNNNESIETNKRYNRDKKSNNNYIDKYKEYI